MRVSQEYRYSSPVSNKPHFLSTYFFQAAGLVYIHWLVTNVPGDKVLVRIFMLGQDNIFSIKVGICPKLLDPPAPYVGKPRKEKNNVS